MAALRPYNREDRPDPESPEALLISALLRSGQFDPERYHIEDDDIVAWKPLWLFARDYQAKAGAAPPLGLVQERFPDFELATAVHIAYAAAEVADAAFDRRIRTGMATSVGHLGQGDRLAAYEALHEIARPRLFTREPTDIFDHHALESRFGLDKIEVPWPTLMRLTKGGITPGELWYVGGRLAHAKSWSLCSMAARAAQAGANVGYSSLEMPAGDVAARILLRLAGTDRDLIRALSSDDLGERKEVQDHLLGRTQGHVGVYDPSHGPVSSVDHIRSMAHDYDLVFVDHVGLLRIDGRRAIEDWRVQAQASNVLREITLETDTSVIAAAQVNREGEHPSSANPPKAKNLAGSDALGQDADVVLTQAKLGTRVISMGAEKVRNGPQGRWFTRFDPAKGRFEEIGRDVALELMDEDGDS